MRKKIEKNKILITLLIFSLVAIFCMGCSSVMNNSGLIAPVNKEQESLEKAGPPEKSDKFFIGFKEKPGPAEQAMIHSAGGKVNFTYHIVDVIAASLPEQALEALKKNPKIQYIEPDIEVSILDTELDDTWGVKQIGAGLVHDAFIKGTGVKVAVIDTGIDYNHPDLNANYRGGYDFVNRDNDPMDDNGHGTHVAGTIAARDDGIGVVGVAPEAELYALKVLNSSGSGSYSSVIAALEWCVENGIKVTNNSYGSTSDAGTSVKNAFDNAYYKYGIINISSAGNSGNSSGTGDNITYPARYDSVIAVGATNNRDQRTSWSSTGPDLEISAPGNSIYSTLIGGSYGLKSGTSMASPHVAGTVALMIAAGISDIRGQLQNTAHDLGATGWDTQYGYGLVNAAEAVSGGRLQPPQDPEPSVGSIAGKVIDATNSNLAIPGAKVEVEGISLFAITDSSGFYEIKDVAMGTYIVNASAIGYESASKSVTVNPDAQSASTADFALKPVSPPPSVGKIYVSNIDMSFITAIAGKNTFYTAVVTVSIIDEKGKPVEGATISGLWSGLTSGSSSGVTSADGIATLQSSKIKNPKSGKYFTFTIENIVKEGWEYIPDKDKNSATIIIP